MNFHSLSTANGAKGKHYFRTYLVALILESAVFFLLRFLDLSPVGQRVMFMIIFGVIAVLPFYRIHRLYFLHDWIYFFSTIYYLLCWSLFVVWDNHSTLSVVCYLGCLITFSLHTTLLDLRRFVALSFFLLLSLFVLPFNYIFFLCLTFLLFSLRFGYGVISMREALNELRSKITLLELKLQSQRYWGHHLLNPLSIVKGHLSLFDRGQKDKKQRKIIISALHRIREALEKVDHTDPAFKERPRRFPFKTPYQRAEWSPLLLSFLYPIAVYFETMEKGYSLHINDILGVLAIIVIAIFPLIEVKFSGQERARREIAVIILFQLLVACIFYFGESTLLYMLCLLGLYLSTVTIMARSRSKLVLFVGVTGSILSLISADLLVTPFMIGFLGYHTYLIFSSVLLNQEYMTEYQVYVKSNEISKGWTELKKDLFPEVVEVLDSIDDHSEELEIDRQKVYQLMVHIEDSIKGINNRDASASFL